MQRPGASAQEKDRRTWSMESFRNLGGKDFRPSRHFYGCDIWRHENSKAKREKGQLGGKREESDLWGIEAELEKEQQKSLHPRRHAFPGGGNVHPGGISREKKGKEMSATDWLIEESFSFERESSLGSGAGREPHPRGSRRDASFLMLPPPLRVSPWNGTRVCACFELRGTGIGSDIKRQGRLRESRPPLSTFFDAML